MYPHSIFACVCIAKDRRSAFAIYDHFLWNSSELCKDAENSTDVFVQATKAFVIANRAYSDVWHKTCLGKQRCFTYSVRGISDLIWKFHGFPWMGCMRLGPGGGQSGVDRIPMEDRKCRWESEGLTHEGLPKNWVLHGGNKEAQTPFKRGTGSQPPRGCKTWSVSIGNLLCKLDREYKKMQCFWICQCSLSQGVTTLFLAHVVFLLPFWGDVEHMSHLELLCWI